MMHYPVIDMAATGDNIRRLRMDRGLSVQEMQAFFGFDAPQAVYKWQRGESLPTVDNLYALSKLLGVTMEDILVPFDPKPEKPSRQQPAGPVLLVFLTRDLSVSLRSSAGAGSQPIPSARRPSSIQTTEH